MYGVVQKGQEDKLELEKKVRIEQQHQLDELKSGSQTQDQKIKELENKLQSKLTEKARLASVEASKTNVVAQVVAKVIPTAKAAPVDSNAAKMFIYMHESGNVPCKINGGAINCNYVGSLACGIGQALPCSKLTNVCKLSDYACQDAFFTRYMVARYGTWENARAFWLAHKWW